MRTVEGIDRVEELSASVADMLRCLVTEERQSTTVPKTSVRRALGGFVVDMTGRVKCYEFDDGCVHQSTMTGGSAGFVGKVEEKQRLI